MTGESMKNIKLNSKWGKALIVVLVLALAVLGIIYPSFGDTVGRVFEFQYLSAATTVLATFTLQIVFFLQKSTGADVIEIATIQNIVINFKNLFISFASQVFAFLLWGIPPLRVFVLMLYSIGGYNILKTISRAIKWMLDWGNEPNIGFRDTQKRKLLNDSKLTVEQRKEIWEAFLNRNIVKKSDNDLKLISSVDLTNLFSTNYEHFVSDDRAWMVNVTFKILNTEFSKTDYYDYRFLKYSMKTLLKLFGLRKKDEHNVELLTEVAAWENNINNAFMLIAKNGRQAYLLRLTIEDNSEYCDNQDSARFLANLILNFLYDLDSGIENSYSNDWKICYQTLSSDTKYSLLIKSLFDMFLFRVRKQRQDDSVTRSSGFDFYKNDKIFETLFKSADPILFNNLETLFALDRFINCGTEYIRTALLKQPPMGYIHGGPVINGSLSSSQADHQIADQKKKEEEETLKIGTLIYPKLKAKKEFTKYSEELQRHLDTLSQEGKQESELLASKIKILKSTIKLIFDHQKSIWGS